MTRTPKQTQLEDLTPQRRAEDLTDNELASIAQDRQRGL
jgi:hypothetical protein